MKPALVFPRRMGENASFIAELEPIPRGDNAYAAAEFEAAFIARSLRSLVNRLVRAGSSPRYTKSELNAVAMACT